jgi:GNAT superfamily N-acetyltransferase
MATAFGRLRVNARYHGWRAALGLLALGVARRFVTFERVLLYELPGIPAGRGCPGPDRVRLATVDEVKALLHDPEFGFGRMSESKAERLYAAGHRCAFNVSAGSVVGYAWLGFDDIEIPQLGLTLERLDHEGYIYKGFTHPSFRGQGAADDRYLFWMQYLLEHGKRSAVAYFSFDNLATLTRVRKLSLRRLGTLTLLGIGRYRRVVVSDGLRKRRRWPLTTR